MSLTAQIVNQLIKISNLGVGFWIFVYGQWTKIKDLRFIGLLLGFGVFLIVGVEQGKDVIATVSDSWGQRGEDKYWWWFVAATAFLGLQSWIWSRFLIQLSKGTSTSWRQKKENWFLVWGPRILGIIPYLAAAWAIWIVPEGENVLIQCAIILLFGFVAFFFYWKRLKYLAKISSWKTARWLFQDHWNNLPVDRFEAFNLIISSLIAVLFTIWLAIDPVTVPVSIGAAALAFLGFALIIPVVSILVARFGQNGFPILTALAVWALAASMFNDNHEVRSLDDAQSVEILKIENRPTIEQAFDRWAAQHKSANDQPIPIIFVSAAGGASRAAIWTTAVMNRLDELDLNFNSHVFAISAVSGGALGAIDNVASRAAFGQEKPSYRHSISRTHTGRDYLSPALAGGLYTDMIQRFIPFPIFRDRSWSIEMGFEREWRNLCDNHPKSDACARLMTGSFLEIYEDQGERAGQWIPNILLVGTLQEDGKRIITSNLKLVEGEGQDQRPSIPNSYDFLHVFGKPISASTAIMNSARFPWISPAGRITAGNGANEDFRGHVLDGGYFEASAADTSFDLAMKVLDIAKKRGVNLKPIFLTLTNGEYIDGKAGNLGKEDCNPENEFLTGRQVPKEKLQPRCLSKTRANDLLAPIGGLFSTQSGRAELTLSRLAKVNEPQVSSNSNEAIDTLLPANMDWTDVRLAPCRTSNDRPLAMSWFLSKTTRNRVYRQTKQFKFEPPAQPVQLSNSCTSAQRWEVFRLACAMRNITANSTSDQKWSSCPQPVSKAKLRG